MQVEREVPWSDVRARAIEARGPSCEDCGEVPDVVHVHHVTYERWGDEPVEDLRVLCPPCHRARHRERPGLATESPRWRPEDCGPDPVEGPYEGTGGRDWSAEAEAFVDDVVGPVRSPDRVCPHCGRGVGAEVVVCGYCFGTVAA